MWGKVAVDDDDGKLCMPNCSMMVAMREEKGEDGAIESLRIHITNERARIEKAVKNSGNRNVPPTKLKREK